MSGSLLQLDNVCCFYENSSGDLVEAVKEASFEVRDGEILGLVGPSGSGKSTLAKAMMGILPGCQGKILFSGTDLYGKSWQKLKKKPIQMVLQDSRSSLNPRMTLFESMEEPLILSGIRDKKRRTALVLEMCHRVGLDEYTARRLPGECSGGQRQRANIGRALILSPKLLLCDEPVSSLDASMQAQIINLLKKIAKETGMTMIFISHDEELVRFLCTRILTLDSSGRVQEEKVRRPGSKDEPL